MFKLFLILFSSFFIAFPFKPASCANINFSGDLEFDGTFETSKEETAANNIENNIFSEEGRILLEAEAKHMVKNIFYIAKAQILVKTDGTTAVDDAYGHYGGETISVKVGRFEGISLFHLGYDTLLIEAPNGPTLYEGNYARGRTDNAGQVALYAKASDSLNFELGSIYGSDTEDFGSGSSIDVNWIGLRPVATYKFSNFYFAFGADYLKSSPQDKSVNGETSKMGLAASVDLSFDNNLVVGVSASNGIISGKNSSNTDIDEKKTLSTGTHIKLGFDENSMGAGIFYSTQKFKISNDKYNHLQGYLSFNQQLGIKNAFIKYAFSMAQAKQDFATSKKLDHSNIGFRIRLYYYF